MRENEENLVATTRLEFEWWKLTRYLNLFALVDDVRGDGHWIIVFAEIRCRDVVDLEEILDETG